MSAHRNETAIRARRTGFIARLLIVLALCVSAQSAWALRCLTTSGTTSLTEPIGNVTSYPVNVPNGYIIWISPTRTTAGYCYKDLPNTLTYADDVFFYVNPANTNLAAYGLEVGIRYNGTDHFEGGNQAGTGIPTGYVVPALPSNSSCTAEQRNNGTCSRTSVSITYQVVIRKSGTWIGTPPNTYAAFQFDGVNGLNALNTSFRYHLTGLNNLQPTPCVVNVTVTPEPGIVEFGKIQATPTGFSPATPSQPFQLRLDKTSCDTPINMSGYFQTSHPVQNDLVLPSADSHFGIAITNAQGQRIPIAEPFAIANFTATQTRIVVPMTAELHALGPPKIGPFNAVVTIQLLYD